MVGSEDKLVVLVKGGVPANNVLAERVDLLARLTNLVIEGLLLAPLLLKFYEFVFLVEGRLDAALLDHSRNKILSLISRDAEELADLIEANVHVNA